MSKIWKNYKQTIILVVAILIGAMVGCLCKEKVVVLKPLGDLYINLMFVIVIPLIFLTISTAISKMKQPKRLGKIMGATVFVIIVTSIIAVIVGLGSTYFIKLVETEDSNNIRAGINLEDTVEEDEKTILERTVEAVSVSDFSGLFSKQNLIAIMVFSILVGIAMNMSGEKARPVERFLVSCTDVIMNLLKIITYYAPIGLGCYFAVLVGTFGESIALGYFKTFIVYTVIACVFYIIVYSIYAFISGGKDGVKRFWKNIINPTVTSIATCSSAACIPVNIESAKKMGVEGDIAETVIPLGTSFHKDGSIIGTVFKIMFLVCLFGTDISGVGGIAQILIVGLVATLLVSAVPIGGGTISEMMILSMMGYPVAALPILTIIATIIDPPATMLNVTGNTVSSMLVHRIVEGKEKKGDIVKKIC
ncbi:MAG: dicarboxylate/amino acid:cation symporter [Clostridiales bacterium]|nr:dicarboxylate/amino acid:cation symporter [Clostridiales bacterium]